MTYYYTFTPNIGTNFLIFGFMLYVWRLWYIGGALLVDLLGIIDLFTGTTLVEFKYLAIRSCFF